MIKPKLVKYNRVNYWRYDCPRCHGSMACDWDKQSEMSILKCILCGAEVDPTQKFEKQPEKRGRKSKQQLQTEGNYAENGEINNDKNVHKIQ